MSVLSLALIIVGFILAGVHQFIAHGRSILGWAVIVITVALLLPVLAAS